MSHFETSRPEYQTSTIISKLSGVHRTEGVVTAR